MIFGLPPFSFLIARIDISKSVISANTFKLDWYFQENAVLYVDNLQFYSMIYKFYKDITSTKNM